MAEKATQTTSDKAEKLAKRRKLVQRNLFLLCAVVLMTIYLGWRMFFTLPLNDGIPQVVFGVLLVGAECVTTFTTFELYYRKLKSDFGVLDFPEVPENEYPDVDVFIATHNEPLDILYKTANACTFMDYPDKSKVHIYFCDDGNRPTVAALAAELGIGYLGLANNKDAKSGNLNNALAKTTSPLIATFDADMIPQHTFLMKTVPYFFLPTYIKDKKTKQWRKRTPDEIDKSFKIGLIQTPQSFYNPDLFQFNLYAEDTIPNEQDFFSREVNIMRNSSNAISYTGSNTLILRQGMLDIGGFPLKTITEDFEVSVRLQQQHYITYATSEIQAAGLTTTDFGSMVKQRKRWAMGIIQSLQNTNAIFSRKFSIAGRLTYFTSYLYWWSFLNRIIFILSPIMFALFDFRVVDCTFEELLVLWLPAYFFYTVSFRYLSSDVRTNRWSQTIDTIFAPYLIGCIIRESLGIHERKFKITSKEKKQTSDFKYATPHIILMVLSILALVRFMWGKYGWALVYGSVIIFWLFYNVLSLSYAIFFMMGRRAYRKSERIKATEQIEVHYGDTVIAATTIDLSDEGMMFVHDKPVYVPPDTAIKIFIKSDRYACELSAKIVYVKEKDGKWQYAVTVVPIDADNKRQYFQFIYDRNHSLPMKVDKWATVSDDIKRNILRRLQSAPPQARKQARVAINKLVTLNGGMTVFLHDFNYKFFAISQVQVSGFNNVLSLDLESGHTLILRPAGKRSQKHDAWLYELSNVKELATQGLTFHDILDELLRD